MNLGRLADVRTGYSFRSRLEHDPAGDVVVIQMKDIDDANLLHPENAFKVSLPEGKGRHLLKVGDLVFRSRGRSNSVALVAADMGAAVLAAPMLLIRPHGVLPAYLHWYINTPSTQAALAAMSEGTSVRMISKDAIQDLDVPLPSMARQRQIVAIAGLAQQEQALLTAIATQRKRITEGLLLQHAQKQMKEMK